MTRTLTPVQIGLISFLLWPLCAALFTIVYFEFIFLVAPISWLNRWSLLATLIVWLVGLILFACLVQRRLAQSYRLHYGAWFDQL